MSVELSSVASKQFDDIVKHDFQTAGKLRPTVTIRNNVVGATYDFRRMGKGLATQRTAPSSDVVPMDVEHDLITCTLTDWDADEYTDIFNSKEVNFDETRELAKTIAGALGRRLDQLIIDACNASGTFAGTVTVAEGGSNTNLNIAKLRKAKMYLDDQGVPSEGRYAMISASGLYGLLGETQTTSADYNTVRALVNGEINTFMGFTFNVIESRSEGGLSKATNTRDCYFYHMDAIGMAIGMDISTKIDWIPHKKSWLSAGQMKAGAVVRDGYGIVKVQAYES